MPDTTTAPAPPAPPAPPARNEAFRAVLDVVTRLATRLQEWTMFLERLRPVGDAINVLVVYANTNSTTTTAGADEARRNWNIQAIEAIRSMCGAIEENQWGQLAEIVNEAQAITTPSPIPRPKNDVLKQRGDVDPRAIIDVFAAWIEAVRKFEGDTSVPVLLAACGAPLRCWKDGVKECIAQMKHESRGLTNLVRQLEALL